ncbi:hypothetical protein O6H91_22G007100 [Diphasiastrum complanatum]|uniref:Uncharacterized protein n=1 Tax=Diphasiastrum complanatum TaxID=34168 RepID=A0ACC2ADQ2_DIPCM|nr:hypothetical protein O6H91_22G007100 [Diphasiastrum complanatum]
MKKRGLNVRIDGVWYRVAHGKLCEITRPGSGHAGGSEAQTEIAEVDQRDSSTQVSDEGSVGDNMTTLSMYSTEKKLSHKPAKRSSYFSDTQRRLQAPPDEFHTEDNPTAATKKRRSGWNHEELAPGAREEFSREPETATGIDGQCSFVRGMPQQTPPYKLYDSEHVYDSDESCMSTATSARKPLVIRLRMTKVTGQ